jgi:DNA-binding transcriptional regulator GbsR (MarR family)
MSLTPVAQQFILHWGEMGSKWGVNRTVAQIHALLYLRGVPISADDIVEILGVARSNVSNSLKELQSWNLIRTVHVMGDRRDHFETSTDVWELMRTIMRERKEREFDPTVQVLKGCLASPDLNQETLDAQQRIKQTLELMQTLGAWGEEMLRLNPDVLMKVMKLGAKVQKFVRQDE